MGWLQRLNEGLAKTRLAVRGALDRFVGRGPDPAALEELEAALIAADLGVHTARRLMDRLQAEARGQAFTPSAQGQRLLEALKETILDQLRGCEGEPIDRLVDQGPRPYVILAVGVNGVGKTTTVAKLAQ